MMKHLLSILLAVLWCNAPCQSAPRNAPVWVTEPAITAADLRQRLYLIADDSLMGRETGSLGAFKASAYVAAEFRRLGLEPAGDNGTYFQTVPFWDVKVDPRSRLVTSGGTTLHLGADFLPVSFAVPPRVLEQTAVVYAGSVGDTAHLMAAPGVAGKFVVLDVPQGFDRRAIGPLLGRYHEASTIGIVALDQLGSEQIARIREGRPVSDTTRNPRAIALVWLSRQAAAALLGKEPAAIAPGSATGTTVSGQYDFTPTSVSITIPWITIRSAPSIVSSGRWAPILPTGRPLMRSKSGFGRSSTACARSVLPAAIRSATAPTTTAPERSRFLKSRRRSPRPRGRSDRGARSSSSATRERKRDSSARAGIAITRRCRSTRSSAKSIKTWSGEARRPTSRAAARASAAPPIWRSSAQSGFRASLARRSRRRMPSSRCRSSSTIPTTRRAIRCSTTAAPITTATRATASRQWRSRAASTSITTRSRTKPSTSVIRTSPGSREWCMTARSRWRMRRRDPSGTCPSLLIRTRPACNETEF